MSAHLFGGVFSKRDQEEIEARGVVVKEAVRQIRLLRQNPIYTDLDRPCKTGDGIEQIPPKRIDESVRCHQDAAAAGRILHLIPASGAASRMFRDLLFYQTRTIDLTRTDLETDLRCGVPEAEGTLEFLDQIDRFAFTDDLRDLMTRRGTVLDRLLESHAYRTILDSLLAADGLNLDDLPKGLIRFHRYADGTRTPLEEHLVETARVSRDSEGRCRLHFTVSPDHLEPFRRHLERVRGGYEERLGVRFEVAFSMQDPSTDTLAIDETSLPARTADGRLLFRPGGHGSLLRNLERLEADAVLVKNVDNVAVDGFKSPTYLWTQIISGTLLMLQARIHRLLRRLEENPSDRTVVEDGLRLAQEKLRIAVPTGIEAPELRKMFDRPIRVCGMVPNTGEPGGGPFWVLDRSGATSRQIVERAQVDPASESQKRLFETGTHFNPVFMALGLRDHRGRHYELRHHVDQRAYVISRKAAGGQDLTVFEHPGLWNGGMAHWNTLFVEMPVELFNPVKTIRDLLRKEHQPA